MPDQPTWHARIPLIIESLEKSEELLLDRFSLERLLHLSRRQTLRVMSSLGGYQIGCSYVVERQVLLRQLKSIQAQAHVERLLRRKRRIWQSLQKERDTLQARSIPIKSGSLPSLTTWAALPEGISLRPGALTITYSEPQELLRRLYILSQILAKHYESFLKFHSSTI
jgi:hypothetical protein